MKITYVHETHYYWRNGCWLYRNYFPSKALRARGHQVQLIVLGTEMPDPEVLAFPDVVVFSRTYDIDAIPLMRKLKQLGKKVVYEIDDDFNIFVRGDLDLTNTKVTSLPDNLYIRGDLYLEDTNVSSLPDNLTVGRDLYLRNTNITSLTDNLIVRRNLYKDF